MNFRPWVHFNEKKDNQDINLLFTINVSDIADA